MPGSAGPEDVGVMPGSAGPAAGVCSACGAPGGATDSFCEACGTELAWLSIGQAGLALVIQEGLEARKHGDRDTATAKLGRAVALAQQSGNEDTAKLAKVVDVVDAASGTVRLKKNVEDADEMALDTWSTKTIRTTK
jgi:von Willebrand factor type A C-terminal domain